MSALVRAELARVRARTVVWGTALVLVVAALGFVVAAWDDTRPPTEQQVAEAQVAFDAALADHERHHDEQVARCEEVEGDVPADEDGTSCEELFAAPVLEAFLPYRPALAETFARRLQPMTWVLVVGLLVMGVSLVSADLASGAMSTWLTFAPRRGRVLLSRLVAALAAAVPVAVLALGTAALGIVAVLAWNGALGTDRADAAQELASITWRALATGLWATTLGLGLAFALRHAAAVAGVVVWWVAAVESALPTIFPQARGVTLGTNLGAWVEGVGYWLTEECAPDAAGVETCTTVEHVVTQAQGGLVLLGVALVALGLGALAFRLRDIG
ncbi:ABC transporter permease subunit [Cellulomonas sp. DKR-3]|uniref:ABC transporter permease subunit n=1 Tax=Cellulomonas fulva TaxID=2835530 RepID=A0ABS5U1W5_9CELL|nr:ABC transporter permease subunit [Cellulomonas fulva]MBT0995383.1 ABC transporter permease subunit [Cellulomonas fulva]